MEKSKTRVALGYSALGLAGLGACVGIGYLILAWRGELPNAETRKLEAVHENRVAIPDADNAWVGFYGISAPADQDAQGHGVRRVEWLRHQRTSFESIGPDPGAKDPKVAELETPVFKRITDDCRDSTAKACLAAIEQATSEPLLRHEAVLLERYRSLMGRGWYEALIWRDGEPNPEYRHVLAAQRVMLIRLRQAVLRGEPAQVRDTLERDLAFARRMLAQSDGLMSKVLAVVLVRQHFLHGSQVLGALPPDQVMAAVPPGWLQPFSADELAMWRSMAGELVFIRQRIQAEYEHRDSHDENRVGRLVETLKGDGGPVEDINRTARLFAGTAESFSVPLRDYPKARTSLILRADVDGQADMALYAFRVGSVEGMRRLALLLAQMRGRSLPVEQVEEAVRKSELRTPFQETPFTWLAQDRTLEFEGPARRRSGLALVY